MVEITSTVLFSLFLCEKTFAVSSLHLSVDTNVIDLNIANIKPNGTFAKSDNATITASTDNATGYELRIAATNTSSYSSLINTEDNNETITSIESATTEAQFSSLSGTSYNGMWGYLPSKYESSTNTDFRPAPTTSGDIINKTECANNTANCPDAQDTYTMSIGARIDSSVKVGTYQNTFVILATANAIPYTVTFDDSIVSNMPTDISSSSISSTVQLPNNTPVRDGYTFLGWCSEMPTSSGNGNLDVCSGTTYAAGADFALNQTGTGNDLHLFAMWEKAAKTIANSTYLQEVEACPSTLTTGHVYTLTDSRDNEQYKVAKLADNKCWLLDNLRLDPTSVSLSTLQGKTNATDGTLIYLKNGGGTSSDKYAVNALSNWTSGYSYNTPYVNTASKNVISTVTYGSGSGKIGVYYNYCAISAGSYCYSFNEASYSGATSSGDASEDLCPYKWRIPTGGQNGEYQALYDAYNNDVSAFQNALSTPLSGYFMEGTIYEEGTSGYFTSSTRRGNIEMNSLGVAADAIYPNMSLFRSRRQGESIRCLFKDD